VRDETHDDIGVKDASYEVFDEAFDKIIDEARSMSETLRRQANGDPRTGELSDGEVSASEAERKGPSAGTEAGD
jgi:hypothetical protein